MATSSNPVGVWNPTFYIGDTVSLTFDFADSAGDPEDRSGYTPSLMLRISKSQTSPDHDWSSYFDSSAAASGRFTLSVPPSVTRLLDDRIYYIDFQLATAADAEVQTFAAGYATAVLDVTR